MRYVTANFTGDIARVERRRRYAPRAKEIAARLKLRPSMMVEQAAMLVSEGPKKQQILRCVARRSKNERGKKARDSAQDERVTEGGNVGEVHSGGGARLAAGCGGEEPAGSRRYEDGGKGQKREGRRRYSVKGGTPRFPVKSTGTREA